jgi:Peptidase family M28
MKRNDLTLAIFPVVFILLAFSGTNDDQRTTYGASITAADLKRHLSILASDEYEGRETGKTGQKMAAAYIAAQFKLFGMQELPSGGYYQDVPLISYMPGEGYVQAGNEKFVFEKDFYYTSGIENGDAKASSVVFAGYGIQDEKWKDYEGLDVKDKLVIAFAGDPVDASGKSRITGTKEMSPWASQRRKKTMEASNRGAAALFIVVPDLKKAWEENSHSIMASTLKLDEEVSASALPMLVLYISREMADKLLLTSKKGNCLALEKKMTKKKKPQRFEFPLQTLTDIHRKSVSIHSENVLGYLEGTDLKNELIVVTAHYDHLGKEGNVVYNGADDDGSGTVAVIELAEAFSKAKKEGHGPRRSMLFMCVTGEEKGLLGSRWYTNHPVFPLENTVCDLNIDMIGRKDKDHETDTNYVYVIGSDKLSSELKTINEQANSRYTNIKLDYRFDDEKDPNMFYYRSDHYNFAKHNIPVAFFFNGVHADYHKETDEVSKISFALMEQRARLVFYTGWEIANREKRLVVDQKKK